MNEIKIKCPNCGKILRLADAPNINQATFTCPICKKKNTVGNCRRIFDAPSTDETQYSGSNKHNGIGTDNDDNDKTRIGHAPQQQAIGHLVDNSGNIYNLSFGINTIGRKAVSSNAMVQISTDDLYMSRSHAVIDIQQTGGKTMHILKNDLNKNPSYLNGSLINPNDKLILNDGDHLVFGKTELTFKK